MNHSFPEGPALRCPDTLCLDLLAEAFLLKMTVLRLIISIEDFNLECPPAFLSVEGYKWQCSVSGLLDVRSWYTAGADPAYQPHESGEGEIAEMPPLVSWPPETGRRLCLQRCWTGQKGISGHPGERPCLYR